MPFCFSQIRCAGSSSNSKGGFKDEEIRLRKAKKAFQNSFPHAVQARGGTGYMAFGNGYLTAGHFCFPAVKERPQNRTPPGLTGMFGGTRSINMRTLILNLREGVASGNLALNDVQSHPTSDCCGRVAELAHFARQIWMFNATAAPGRPTVGSDCSESEMLHKHFLAVRKTSRPQTGCAQEHHHDHPWHEKRSFHHALQDVGRPRRLRGTGAAGDWLTLAVIRRSWGRALNKSGATFASIKFSDHLSSSQHPGGGELQPVVPLCGTHAHTLQLWHPVHTADVPLPAKR
ncbi:hypothetical protein CT0861_02414 [Colletotrichum tofieldiae]|uniref:Uncharacterized protein n=1 Tax=Colletotrichum tofieldiae TaxID=708197 RepID=A0A166LEB8_9PEZI|nr:hypothetical protein CT0861_02414 [Colletotrichum tofieldiae]